MEQFYKKVKEGGYDFERLGSPKTVGDRDRALLLDPEAWVALGKAEGWKIEEFTIGDTGLLSGASILEWKGNWHMFIEHLASGGDTEEFFTNLLTK